MSIQWERPMIDGRRCEAAACVEVASSFVKSSYSSETNCVEVSATALERCEAGQCVETASAGDAVLVRDSKLGDDSPVLRFTRSEWAAFRGAILDGQFAYDEQREHAAKAGEFDLPKVRS